MKLYCKKKKWETGEIILNPLWLMSSFELCMDLVYMCALTIQPISRRLDSQGFMNAMCI